MIQTNRTGSPSRTEMWFVGRTSASAKSGSITYQVQSLRGRTVEPEVDQPSEFETNWTQVIAASAMTSLSFLKNEPDLYED